MRKFWMVLIGLAFISGLVFTQTPVAKPDKQLVLAREMLLNEIGVIKAFVVSIAEKSNTAFTSDLCQLQKMVNNFSGFKGELLKAIDSPFSIFTENDASKVAFIYQCEEAMNEYSSRGFWYSDDDLQTIKRFFMKYTGKEMEIERTKRWGIRIFLGILLGVFGAIMIGGLLHDCLDEVVGWVVGLIIFFGWLALCFFVF